MRCYSLKIFSLILIISLLIPSAFASDIAAHTTTYLTYNEWENNMLISNSIIDAFFSYYKENPNAAPVLPNYYAGFNIHPDGTLTMYSTDVSPHIIELVYTICGSNGFEIVLVEHSFNELLHIANEVCLNSGISQQIECAFISISNNCVDFYVAESSGTASAYDLTGVDDSLPVAIYNYTTIDEAIQNSYCISAEDVVVASKPETFSVNSPFSTNSTTLAYGAPSYAAGYSGTVGYLALDTSGDKILVTHGHDLTLNNLYRYGGNTQNTSLAVGTVTDILGATFPLDAAIITLYNSTTITNQAYWNSDSRFSAVAGSNSEISSVNGQIGFFYGSISNEVSGEVYYNIEAGECFLKDGDNSVKGDSGAPVYLKTSATTYKLLGIQTGWNTAGVKVNTVPDIKDEHPHYVYLSSNSYT